MCINTSQYHKIPNKTHNNTLKATLKNTKNTIKTLNPYKSLQGECNTCAVNFNGQMVKACQSSLPASSSIKSFQIGIPNTPQGKIMKK